MAQDNPHNSPLDHYRNPRNHGELPKPSRRCEGFNSLCGDEVILTIALDRGVISDLKFFGQGCSISQASASMMTVVTKGQSVAYARKASEAAKAMLSASESADWTASIDLGDLPSLQGVIKFPVRIKCATLAWNTLLQGLDEIGTTSTTG